MLDISRHRLAEVLKDAGMESREDSAQASGSRPAPAQTTNIAMEWWADNCPLQKLPSDRPRKFPKRLKRSQAMSAESMAGEAPVPGKGPGKGSGLSKKQEKAKSGLPRALPGARSRQSENGSKRGTEATRVFSRMGLDYLGCSNRCLPQVGRAVQWCWSASLAMQFSH